MDTTITENKRFVVSKWRNAVSVLESETGEITVSRFLKIQKRWKQILYFRNMEDFDDFIDWLDGVSEELGEDE